MEITNREQICATIGFGDNGDRTVAEEIARMLDAADVAFLDSEDVERLAAWMGLMCDEDNEWGKLPPRISEDLE